MERCRTRAVSPRTCAVRSRPAHRLIAIHRTGIDPSPHRRHYSVHHLVSPCRIWADPNYFLRAIFPVPGGFVPLCLPDVRIGHPDHGRGMAVTTVDRMGSFAAE